MTGHIAGFHPRVRSASDTPTTFTHCMIHREALVAITPFYCIVKYDGFQSQSFEMFIYFEKYSRKFSFEKEIRFGALPRNDSWL